MSMLHCLELGFFRSEIYGDKEIDLDTCLRCVMDYSIYAPDHLRIQPVSSSTIQKDTTGVAYADGYPIYYCRGTIICPYFSTRLHYSSIGFMIFSASLLQCDIYSPDDGNFLSAEELKHLLSKH